MKPEIIEEELTLDGIYRILKCPICLQMGTIYSRDFVRMYDFEKTCIPHVECKQENRREFVRKYRRKRKEGLIIPRQKARSDNISGGKYLTNTKKRRVCLKCEVLFMSNGIYNRICPVCEKTNHEYRTAQTLVARNKPAMTDEQLVHNFMLFG